MILLSVGIILSQTAGNRTFYILIRCSHRYYDRLSSGWLDQSVFRLAVSLLRDWIAGVVPLSHIMADLAGADAGALRGPPNEHPHPANRLSLDCFPFYLGTPLIPTFILRSHTLPLTSCYVRDTHSPT